MEVLTVDNDRQDRVVDDFEERLIKRKMLTDTIIVLQEDFNFTFNDIKLFKKKMNDLERG